MALADAASTGATPSESYQFTEDVILNKAPDLNGVFGLFRCDRDGDSEEAVLIDAGNLLEALLVARRTRAAPRANRFRFEICSVGPQMAELRHQWERMMPSTYGKRWRPSGKTVGEGGQCRVHLVEDITGKKEGQHALKLLKSVNSAQARARFKTEVEATQRIQHPSVLKICDFDLESTTPYYVAEYCQGESLQRMGAARFKGNLKAILATILPISDALVAAHHARVIHRDVKPANILFREDGTPVIGDFGICYVEDGEPVTLSDEAVGSRHYLAPEMEAGNRSLGEPTEKTDVYSLGKVIFWMISGGKKFDRENHRSASLVGLLGEQRFEHVHELLDRMVAYEPKERIKSDDVRPELVRVLALVEGNYAPLKASLGIQCRFCGIGKYERWSAFDSTDPKNAVRLQPISKLGLQNYAGANFRILRCAHCGHVELFQFESIKAPKWWNA
jgi:hypothetical protein